MSYDTVSGRGPYLEEDHTGVKIPLQKRFADIVWKRFLETEIRNLLYSESGTENR
jgi:hypothetical protein